MRTLLLLLLAVATGQSATVGIDPVAVFFGSAYECQKKCVQLFPQCSAVVYYYVKNDSAHHYCYLFDHNSASENVSLIEQKPPSKKELVRMLELVEDCHEFDAFPPIRDEEGFASSSDRVDRKKRHDGEEMEAGEWTDWSPCANDTDGATRTRECLYGRKIERRGCPARQNRPAPQPDPRLAPIINTQSYPDPRLQPQTHDPRLQPQAQDPRLQPQSQDPRLQPQSQPLHPDAQRSPSDAYAQQMATYRPRMRHPAIQTAVPCTGPRCPAPTILRPSPPTRAHPIAPPTQPPPPPPLPTRYRPAPPPAPQCNSPGCIPTRAPLGEWMEWSEWSACSCTCDDGLKQRRRDCTTAVCMGDEYEEAVCSMGPCQTWSEWCEWSECQARDGRGCGPGESSRTRFCLLGTQRCEGKDYEARQCDAGLCPEWSDWQEWSGCSTTCGEGGRRNRQRTCLGGTRGDECQGNRVEEGPCPSQRPCSFWGPWAEWSQCSASCGRGNKRRARVCQHGTDCLGDMEETLFCDGPPCAQWTEWCEWSECSASCGPGQRERSRACMGSDGRDSSFCFGPAQETMMCEGENCCQWSEWCPWSDCDKPCGMGQSQRSRVCERSGGGLGRFDDTCQCPGPENESRQCNPQPCQPQCQWTEWCAWSECSTLLQCEVGMQLRSRQCVGEAGCECFGLAEENQQCRGRNPCPTKVPC